MNIPKYFDLMGHTVTVKRIKLPISEKSEFGTLGKCDKDDLNIILYNMGYPDTVMEQTYLHEVLHMCLDYMGKYDLSKDEEFVDSLAGLLYQAIESGRDE